MKVGDQIYVRLHNGTGDMQTITSEGLAFLWTDRGMAVQPGTRDVYRDGRTFAGRAYASEEEFQREDTNREVWKRFASMVLRSRGTPRGCSKAEIEAAARCLGWTL